MRNVAKAVAPVVAFFFSFTTVCFGSPYTTFQDQIPIMSPPALTVPEQYGTVTQSYTAGERGTVIILEDAHTSLGTQYALAEAISYLTKTYEIPVVTFEGYAGELGSRIDAAFGENTTPEECAQNKNVADFLMQQGELTGSQYAYLFRETPFMLAGAEDAHSYATNID